MQSVCRYRHETLDFLTYFSALPPRYPCFMYFCISVVSGVGAGASDPHSMKQLRMFPVTGSSSNLCHPLLYCAIILVFHCLLSKIFSACISLVLWTLLCSKSNQAAASFGSTFIVMCFLLKYQWKAESSCYLYSAISARQYCHLHYRRTTYLPPGTSS